MKRISLTDPLPSKGVHVMPFYSSREQEEEEKKFVSPLERPKKPRGKNLQNKIIYH